jgi:hypothetical protein
MLSDVDEDWLIVAVPAATDPPCGSTLWACAEDEKAKGRSATTSENALVTAIVFFKTASSSVHSLARFHIAWTRCSRTFITSSSLLMNAISTSTAVDSFQMSSCVMLFRPEVPSNLVHPVKTSRH